MVLNQIDISEDLQEIYSFWKILAIFPYCFVKNLNDFINIFLIENNENHINTIYCFKIVIEFDFHFNRCFASQ